jgi:hypothetical protein
MDLTEAAHAWREDGFVILPGFIAPDELKPAASELELLFPSAEGFHDATDPRRERFIGDQFAGIDYFPFASTEISLLAVNHRILALAETLLEDGSFQIYGAEAWAKYAGASDYNQDLHRDYLGHTLLVPSTAPGFRQLEMFVYLADVSDECGPAHLVSRKHTAELAAVPDRYLRPGLDSKSRLHDGSGSPHLYGAEVSATGPAGTVVAFESRDRASRDGHDRAARRPVHHALELPSLRRPVGPAPGLGLRCRQGGMVQVRRAGHSAPAPGIRVPTARTSLLDTGDVGRDGAAVSGARPHALARTWLIPSGGAGGLYPQAASAPDYEDGNGIVSF